MKKIHPLTIQRIENTFNLLENDKSKINKVFENLQFFKNNQLLHPKYIANWENILQLPLKDIKEKLLANNDEGELLRTTSIFIGLK